MKKKRDNPFGNSPFSVKEPELPKEKINDITPEHKKLVETFVKKHLRRASLQWSSRNLAIKEARVERGFYKCAECSNLFGHKQINLDHKQPVQPIGREIDLITWIYRLLCSVDNFQVLCRGCHDGKTLAENQLRQVRKMLKPKKKR